MKSCLVCARLKPDLFNLVSGRPLIPNAQVVAGAGGSQAAVCYVCQLPKVRGKFLPQKAASLGVQRGPLFGKLQKGESVQSASGRQVHPHEVLSNGTHPGYYSILLLSHSLHPWQVALLCHILFSPRIRTSDAVPPSAANLSAARSTSEVQAGFHWDHCLRRQAVVML